MMKLGLCIVERIEGQVSTGLSPLPVLENETHVLCDS